VSVAQIAGAALVLIGLIGLVTLALYLLGNPARSERPRRSTHRRGDPPSGS
jgi:hypothetical protein